MNECTCFWAAANDWMMAIVILVACYWGVPRFVAKIQDALDD